MRLSIHFAGAGSVASDVPVPVEFTADVDWTFLEDVSTGPAGPPDILCLSDLASGTALQIQGVESVLQDAVAVLVRVTFRQTAEPAPRLDAVTDDLSSLGFRFAGFQRLRCSSPSGRPIGQRSAGNPSEGDALFLRSVPSLSETREDRLPALAFAALCFGQVDVAMAALAVCPETHLEPPTANWLAVLRRLQIAGLQEIWIEDGNPSRASPDTVAHFASENRTRLERILYDTGFKDLSDKVRETRLLEVAALAPDIAEREERSAAAELGHHKARKALRGLRSVEESTAYLDTVVRFGFGRGHTDLFWGDRLMTLDKSAGFLRDESFRTAWLANDEWHRYDQYAGEHGIAWRLHTLEWAARYALTLPRGDFVECGVFKGDMSAFVYSASKFADSGRKLYLFDSFEGIDPARATDGESPDHIATANLVYRAGDLHRTVVQRFSGYENVVITKGYLPEALDPVEIREIAWLHLDLNAAQPEIQTLALLFDKIVPGGVIILDDYGWSLLKPQKNAHDRFFGDRGYRILELPTGQGLIIKRPD